jgi:hypothetical protein
VLKRHIVKIGRFLSANLTEIDDTTLKLTREYAGQRRLDIELGEFKSDQELLEQYRRLFTERRKQEDTNNVTVN